MNTITRWATVKSWHRETSHPDPWKLVLDMGYSRPHSLEEELTLQGSCLSDPDMRNAPLGSRVKITIEIQEPKVKVVPWKAEEVPLGCWIRMNGGQINRSQVIRVDETGVVVMWRAGQPSMHIDFKELARCFDHSTDGGKTWHPAGKETVTYE